MYAYARRDGERLPRRHGNATGRATGRTGTRRTVWTGANPSERRDGCRTRRRGCPVALTVGGLCSCMRMQCKEGSISTSIILPEPETRAHTRPRTREGRRFRFRFGFGILSNACFRFRLRLWRGTVGRSPRERRGRSERGEPVTVPNLSPSADYPNPSPCRRRHGFRTRDGCPVGRSDAGRFSKPYG